VLLADDTQCGCRQAVEHLGRLTVWLKDDRNTPARAAVDRRHFESIRASKQRGAALRGEAIEGDLRQSRLEPLRGLLRAAPHAGAFAT
jgi:hypothetical protein